MAEEPKSYTVTNGRPSAVNVSATDGFRRIEPGATETLTMLPSVAAEEAKLDSVKVVEA